MPNPAFLYSATRDFQRVDQASYITVYNSATVLERTLESGLGFLYYIKVLLENFREWIRLLILYNSATRELQRLDEASYFTVYNSATLENFREWMRLLILHI